MIPIITVSETQIQAVSPTGIHFNAHHDDADFLPFAVCYESIMLFVASNEFALMMGQLVAEQHHLKLMNIFNKSRAVAIYDDLNQPSQNTVSFLFNLNGPITLFRFTFETFNAYQDFRQQVTNIGWQIFNTTDLL